MDYSHTTIDYADFGPLATELWEDETIAATVHFEHTPVGTVDEIQCEVTV